MNYLLAIDQGTTSSRTILFDEQLNEIARSQKEFTQYFPQPGYVEHDAEEIWESQLYTIREVIKRSGIAISSIVAIGIANQRETVVAWNKTTGKPVHHAIVWQDRRTADICETLKQQGLESKIHEVTGLVVDAYFSATKIKWLLDHVQSLREHAERGEICFGTIDTWLIWKLTEGRIHATDFSNASRTMLLNIRELKWDDELLSALDIPKQVLPEVKNSVDDYGTTNLFDHPIPIYGVAGDQQAALFGQRCFEKGSAKNTYGTGCFMLMNTGGDCILSKSKLLTTIAWRIGNKTRYALEGSVFIAGAAVQWLRDQLGIIQASTDTEAIAAALPGNGNVYFVPAFTGLGAPHWDMYATGTISGITRGTTKEHIIRAALESIAYQTRDVFDAMTSDAGIQLTELKVDGGASANNWLMQFQSDILQTTVLRPAMVESTALGAAMFAGIGAGLFTEENFTQSDDAEKFFPLMSAGDAEVLYTNWKEAMHKCVTHR